ncbi:anti-sigma factor antagonist [Planomonospora sp. ID67723]|uniref:STAS domain-containing protein n=1 Tax=Planomonospora sp. ID67723 TaxID=2738134 RepID=UPI001E518AA3|nr:anti-sigma factor antagonist [Planomonospora sp. ID67723]
MLFDPARGPAFTVSFTEHEGVVVAHLSGELDLRSAPVLRDQLRPFWGRPGTRAMIIDMSELGFCDSIGLGELLSTMKRSQQAGMRFMLSEISDVVARVLSITGLRNAFETHASTAEALRQASSP